MEKVHSAVIGWMLSDKCEAFGQNGLEARSRLLQNIFKIDESEQISDFKSIKAIIEWKNIDILVVTNSGEEDEKCWIIENKIKSTQHSDQLNRYTKIINCKYLMSSRQYPVYFMDPRKFDVNKFKLNPYTDTKKDFCFLTLIEEKPSLFSSWSLAQPGIKEYSPMTTWLRSPRVTLTAPPLVRFA